MNEDEKKAALARAGIGGRYWLLKLRDHGEQGAMLQEWVRGAGPDEIRAGRGVTVVGTQSALLLHLIAKGLMLNGVGCRVIDVADIIDQNTDHENREPMDSVTCLLIQRFHDESYTAMFSDAERRNIERLLYHRMNEGMSVCIQADDQTTSKWNWGPKLIDMIQQSNMVIHSDHG